MWNLIISAFTALGTCGATILALYFWYNDNKIKLNIRSMHADTYGNIPQVEGGFFVVILTNIGYRPLMIEMAGLKAYERKFSRQRKMAFHMCENTQFGSLPKRLEYGDYYIYAIPMTEICKRTESLDLKIAKLKLFVCSPTAKRDIHYKLDRTLRSTTLNH